MRGEQTSISINLRSALTDGLLKAGRCSRRNEKQPRWAGGELSSSKKLVSEKLRPESEQIDSHFDF